MSSLGSGDVSSAVTSTAPSAPSFPANISSRLLSSSEICSTLRFVSAGNGQRKKSGWRRRKTGKERIKQHPRLNITQASTKAFTTFLLLYQMLHHSHFHFCQLTDLGLDVVHVLLGTERRLAHDALGFGRGRWPQERVLAGATGVNRQHVATRLGFIHPGDVVTWAFFTHKLEMTK